MPFHSDLLTWSLQTCFNILFVSSGCYRVAYKTPTKFILLRALAGCHPTRCAHQWDGVNKLRENLQKLLVCLLHACVVCQTGSRVAPVHPVVPVAAGGFSLRWGVHRDVLSLQSLRVHPQHLLLWGRQHVFAWLGQMFDGSAELGPVLEWF